MNAFTQKAKDMNIERFHIKGVRWFQRSYGNTYHVAYISALIDGVWVELGTTEKEYGYGEQYLCTAGKWLIDNGIIEDKPYSNLNNGYQLNSYSFREENNIDCNVVDVKRQKDM